MRAVDTNVLLRLIKGEDARQTASAEAFVRPGAWVSTVVLAETIWVLQSSYGRTDAEVIATLETLLTQDQVTIQDSAAVAAALELYRARPSLGFSDCLILELARKAGHLPLGTFDRNLAEIKGAERIGGRA